MSSPDCKRQKLTDDVNSVANMSKVSPTKNVETQTEAGTSQASNSKKPACINPNVQTFEEVAKLEGFVDRTMLIEELLYGTKGDKSKYVMILIPSRFGRTVNLDMIRSFCDIEDKTTKTKKDVAKDPTMNDLRANPSRNMKVFLRQFEGKEYEECLIMKREQLVIDHFGRHPVVFLDFKGFIPKNESDTIVFCAYEVQNGYWQHTYLENSEELESRDPGLKRTCTDWINDKCADLETLSYLDVIDGLKNLIMSLRIHWGRKPVFLVDEVDKACVKAMEDELSEDQVCEIGKIITNVLGSILKTKDEQLELQAALVTGVCKLSNGGMTLLDNNMPTYYFSDDRFSEYYGLTPKEVRTLVEKLCGSEGDPEKTNKIISDINAKYNGYYQVSDDGEIKKDGARYCLFSILNYMKNINTKEFCFWSDGGFSTKNLLSMLKKSDKFMNDFQKLVYGDSGTIQIPHQKVVDVKHILGLYRGDRQLDPDALFNFFLQRGYLAYNPEKPIEIVSGTKMINIFKSLPTLDDARFKKSLNDLCEDLQHIFKSLKCQSERTICGHIMAILQHYAIRYEKGEEVDYAVKYVGDDSKQGVIYIDVYGCHGNLTIVIEVKYNSGATGEPGKIGDKTCSSLAAAEDLVKLLPGKTEPEGGFRGKAGTGRDLELLKSQTENYVLIGMAVDRDYTTHMLVFRDTSDWKNVILVNPENHVAETISTYLK